jgi:rhomboid protease GluP
VLNQKPPHWHSEYPGPSSARTEAAPRFFIRSTWLSRKPAPESAFVAFIATLTLALGSLTFWADLGGAQDWMAASSEAIFGRHEYWRVWTGLFAHADVGHLLSNSFLFFILGYFLNGYFGSRLFPWAALVMGGVANALTVLTYNPATEVIGASGVVYWMGGTWLALYFFIARQRARVPRWLRTVGVGLLLFAPQSFEPHVSYQAHLIGFLLGLVSGTAHFFFHRARFRSAEVLEPEPEDEPLDPNDDLPPPEGLAIHRPSEIPPSHRDGD